MSLPDREVAKHWVDRIVVDASGNDVGTCTRVYADLETGAPEWVLVSRPEGHSAVIPLLHATESSGRIQVQVDGALVETAPSPAGEDRLSTDEEAALYQHYGVEYSADASDSILPSEVTEAEAVDAGEEHLEAEPDLTTASTPPTAVETAEQDSLAETAPIVVTEPDAVRSSSAPEELPAAVPAPTPPPAPAAKAPTPPTWQPDIPPQSATKSSVGKIASISGAVAAVVALLLARRRLLARRSTTSAKRGFRPSGRRAAARARAASGVTPAQLAAKAAAAKTVAATNVTAARTAAATNVTAARTAAATNVAKSKAAAAAKTAAAQAAAKGKTSAANTALAVGSGGINVGRTAGRFGAQVAGRSVKLGARGAMGAGRSSRELARSRRERRRNKKAALRAVKSTGGNVAAGATRVKKRGRSAMGKIKTGLTLGTGYVLGTRAGRERYEQIRRISGVVAARPEVQRTTAKVSGAVASKLPPAVAGKLPPSVASKLAGNPPPPSTPPLPPSAF